MHSKLQKYIFTAVEMFFYETEKQFKAIMMKCVAFSMCGKAYSIQAVKGFSSSVRMQS